MGVGNWCFGLAAAMTIGTAAEAATVSRRVSFTVVSAFDSYWPGDERIDTPLPGFWGFGTGSSERGTLTVSDCAGAGCLFAELVVAGRTLFSENVSGTFDKFSGLQDEVSGTKWEEIAWNGLSGVLQYTFDGHPDYTFADATIELAPVPLPAPAILLPMGIGAVAAMRKRRRKIS